MENFGNPIRMLSIYRTFVLRKQKAFVSAGRAEKRSGVLLGGEKLKMVAQHSRLIGRQFDIYYIVVFTLESKLTVYITTL